MWLKAWGYQNDENNKIRAWKLKAKEKSSLELTGYGQSFSLSFAIYAFLIKVGAHFARNTLMNDWAVWSWVPNLTQSSFKVMYVTWKWFVMSQMGDKVIDRQFIAHLFFNRGHDYLLLVPIGGDWDFFVEKCRDVQLTKGPRLDCFLPSVEKWKRNATLKVLLKRNFRMWDFYLMRKFEHCLEMLPTFFTHTASENCFFSRSKLTGWA